MIEPTVAAVLRSDLESGHAWIADPCPFCDRRHEYAGGSLDRDPREALGIRLSLCSPARWLVLEEGMGGQREA
jgi:hypothetical protein